MNALPPACSTEPMRLRTKITLGILLLFAAFLRFMVVTETEVIEPLRADAKQYFTYAYNLKYHHVYSMDQKGVVTGETPSPDYFRNPGYSLLITPFVSQPPLVNDLFFIELAQAVGSTLIVLLVFLCVHRFFAVWVAWSAAILTTLSPHLIHINVYILTEAAAAVSLAILLWWQSRFSVTHALNTQKIWLLIAGCCLASSTLIRPTMQWFIVPMAIWLLLQQSQQTNKNFKANLFALWPLVLGFIAIMSTWWIRNLINFGHLSDPRLFIGTIHHGMYPNFTFEGHPESFGFPYRFDPRSAEITASLSNLLQEVLRRFQEMPAEHLQWYFFGKPIMFWQWNNNAQGAGNFLIYEVAQSPYASNPLLIATAITMYFLHWPLVGLGMLGMILVWTPASTYLSIGQKNMARFSSLLLAYFVLLHMVGAPFPRYSMPLLPVLYVQAILTLYLGLQVWKSKHAA